MWSLVYKDGSEGEEQPAHPRRVHFLTVLYSIHDACGLCRTSSVLVCFSTSRHLETPLRCDRLNVAKPFSGVGGGKDRFDHTTAESLTLQAIASPRRPTISGGCHRCVSFQVVDSLHVDLFREENCPRKQSIVFRKENGCEPGPSIIVCFKSNCGIVEGGLNLEKDTTPQLHNYGPGPM